MDVMKNKKELELLWITGDEAVDAALEGVVSIFEKTCPFRVRGYYLFGSQGSGDALANSDLDIAVVFKRTFEDDAERARVCSLVETYVSTSSIELDLTVYEEERLFHVGNATLKLDSVCIYGEDVRDKLQLPDIDSWIHDRMHDGMGYLRQLRGYTFDGSIDERALPFEYPDHASDFFGYEANGIKEFAVAIGWCASALLALKLRMHVFRKKDCLDLYREKIADEWTDLIEGVFEKIRREWNYTIPTKEEDRECLKALCAQALGFENYFLAMYEEFLHGKTCRQGLMKGR